MRHECHRNAITLYLSYGIVDGMTKQITLRLSDETHDRLKAIAEQERRSLHAQVLIYVDRGVKQDQEGDGTK